MTPRWGHPSSCRCLNLHRTHNALMCSQSESDSLHCHVAYYVPLFNVQTSLGAGFYPPSTRKRQSYSSTLVLMSYTPDKLCQECCEISFNIYVAGSVNSSGEYRIVNDDDDGDEMFTKRHAGWQHPISCKSERERRSCFSNLEIDYSKAKAASFASHRVAIEGPQSFTSAAWSLRFPATADVAYRRNGTSSSSCGAVPPVRAKSAALILTAVPGVCYWLVQWKLRS